MTKDEGISLGDGQVFEWFGADSFDKIQEEMDEVRGHGGRRIEVHPHPTRPGHHLIRIVADGYNGPPTNDSFLCPPIC